MKTWWLSFCDVEKPKGKQFLGVIIIDAYSEIDAHTRAGLLGINPALSEVAFLDITKIDERIKPNYKNRFLTKRECDEAIETT